MTKEQPAPLTEEEHHARAMLLGLRYHHGNGHDPFYYKLEADNTLNVDTFIDANTLEPLIQHTDEEFDFSGLSRQYQARRKLK